MTQSGHQEKVDVLLVDDVYANLMSLEAILRRPDYNLVRASSGEEALRLLKTRIFAVVLLDVMMPGMDGFEVARLAKDLERSHDTPIIFVTAVASEEGYIAKGYAHGAADYLTKPLDPDEVRAKVAVFVELY